ncbi:MAG: MFS transporter [Rhodospirillales bacterium]|nr:MFS transporter [Rhodospirillales bacterium]
MPSSDKAPSSAASPRGESGKAPARALLAWCFFDWANSGFPTVISTFVFAAYFAQAVAPDPVTGQAWWGHALSIAGLVVAAASPLLGAVADKAGARKPWLALFSAACILATALLWFVQPDPSAAIFALFLVTLASIAFELTMVFYNAMLPDLVPSRLIGRLSGWGWGLGYAGGLACLVLCLFVFVQAEPPPFGLDKASAEPVRAVAIVVALWFALFSLPLFLFVPDRKAAELGIGAAMRAGARELKATLGQLRAHANIARFLLASLLYLNGLQTLFAFGGIYAAGAFGMTPAEIIKFGIALNVTAGLGAFLFGFVDDLIGARPTIFIALAGVILPGTAILLVRDVGWFWGLSLVLGTFLGPAQAAGRSMMARLAPKGLETQLFGLYALAGKATNFLGPLVLSLATVATGSQRWGMATIVVFLAAGFAVLTTVSEPARSPRG